MPGPRSCRIERSRAAVRSSVAPSSVKRVVRDRLRSGHQKASGEQAESSIMRQRKAVRWPICHRQSLFHDSIGCLCVFRITCPGYCVRSPEAAEQCKLLLCEISQPHVSLAFTPEYVGAIRIETHDILTVSGTPSPRYRSIHLGCSSLEKLDLPVQATLSFASQATRA
jgi:hypothetical protein